jgi:predicted dehydrogenase
MHVRTPDRALGTIDLSWSVDRVTDSYLTVYGSEGTISVGWNGARYRQASSPDWVEFGSGYRKVACMGAQVVNFCDAIFDGEPLAVTAEDAIASVAVIEAGYASLERSDWISVRSVGDAAAGEQVA